MFERSIVVSSIAILASACSAAEQPEEADQESDISSVEQAIGEASCATATPNAAATVTLNRAEVDLPSQVVNGAYESTAAVCANSDVVGLKAATVRNGTLGVTLNVKFSRAGLTPAQQQAECAQTSFKISYFKNGQNAFKTVGTPGAGFAALQLVESGVPLVSNSRCLNGVTVSWSVPRAGTTPPPDESRTLSSSGKTIFIRSGVPLAADKGVFVVQARDRTGALSEYDFRVDP